MMRSARASVMPGSFMRSSLGAELMSMVLLPRPSLMPSAMALVSAVACAVALAVRSRIWSGFCGEVQAVRKASNADATTIRVRMQSWMQSGWWMLAAQIHVFDIVYRETEEAGAEAAEFLHGVGDEEAEIGSAGMRVRGAWGGDGARAAELGGTG